MFTVKLLKTPCVCAHGSGVLVPGYSLEAKGNIRLAELLTQHTLNALRHGSVRLYFPALASFHIYWISARAIMANLGRVEIVTEDSVEAIAFVSSMLILSCWNKRQSQYMLALIVN